MNSYLLTIPTPRSYVAHDLRVTSSWKQRDRITESMEREVIILETEI
jgi:hypothetical protein